LTVFTSVEVALNKLQTKEGLNLPNNFYSCSLKFGAKKNKKKNIDRKVTKGDDLQDNYVLEY
jgi:hypothetical protein